MRRLLAMLFGLVVIVGPFYGETVEADKPLLAAAVKNATKLWALPEPAVRDALLPAVAYNKLSNGLPLPNLPVKKPVKVPQNQSVLVAVRGNPALPAVVAKPAALAERSVTVSVPVKPTVVAAPKIAAAPAAMPISTDNKKPEPARQNPITLVKLDQPNQLSEADQPSGMHSEQSASVGQTVAVTLPGKGWVYLGTGSVNDGLVYLNYNQDNGDERFSFRTDKVGNKVLQFEKQDLSHGSLERHEVLLKVDGSNRLNNQPVADARATLPAALETKVAVSTRPADVTKNGQVSVYDPTIAVTNTAFQPDNPVPPITTELPTSAPELFKLAQDKEQAHLYPEAMAIYDKLTKEFSNFDNMDQVLFNYARLLENWQDNRRLKDAYDMYLKLQKDYPYSSLIDDARQRTRWLDRNFFRIR
jgi:hypothetical protein